MRTVKIQKFFTGILGNMGLILEKSCKNYKNCEFFNQFVWKFIKIQKKILLCQSIQYFLVLEVWRFYNHKRYEYLLFRKWARFKAKVCINVFRSAKRTRDCIFFSHGYTQTLQNFTRFPTYAFYNSRLFIKKKTLLLW